MGGTVDDIVNVKHSEERRYRLLCADDDSLRVRRLVAVRLSAFIGASAVGFVDRLQKTRSRVSILPTPRGV